MSDFSLFNLGTMSGVHPGTRTQILQRVQLLPADEPDAAPLWAMILWYDDPPAWVMVLQDSETGRGKEGRGWQDTPLMSQERTGLGTGGGADLLPTLDSALAGAGWHLRACATCRHWQPLAEITTDDDLPAGRCTWTSASGPPVPAPARLRYQSGLALGCAQWQTGAYTGPVHGPEAHPALDLPAQPVQPTPAPDMNLRDRVKRLLGKGKPDRPPRSRWTDNLLERSGVGAGTEPCFACQGRRANLGAIVVATPEDDKRTFSVWRCRTCGTYYLNDWIDRWERLDSLETEERLVRLAPGEALSLLALFADTDNAEHPVGRHQRDAQRRILEAIMAERTPLSHQIRQGR